MMRCSPGTLLSGVQGRIVVVLGKRQNRMELCQQFSENNEGIDVAFTMSVYTIGSTASHHAVDSQISLPPTVAPVTQRNMSWEWILQYSTSYEKRRWRCSSYFTLRTIG